MNLREPSPIINKIFTKCCEFYAIILSERISWARYERGRLDRMIATGQENATSADDGATPCTKSSDTYERVREETRAFAAENYGWEESISSMLDDLLPPPVGSSRKIA